MLEATPLDNTKQNHHNRDNQQDMNESAHGIRGDKPQKPEDDQDDDNGLEHFASPCAITELLGIELTAITLFFFFRLPGGEDTTLCEARPMAIVPDFSGDIAAESVLSRHDAPIKNLPPTQSGQGDAPVQPYRRESQQKGAGCRTG
jgi:hypothetical protein